MIGRATHAFTRYRQRLARLSPTHRLLRSTQSREGMFRMGIVRSVEWKLICPPDEADTRIREGMRTIGLEPEGPPRSIQARSKRSLMKNRWAAELSTEISPSNQGSVAVCRVDMLGTKHFAVLDEIAKQIDQPRRHRHVHVVAHQPIRGDIEREWPKPIARHPRHPTLISLRS